MPLIRGKCGDCLLLLNIITNIITTILPTLILPKLLLLYIALLTSLPSFIKDGTPKIVFSCLISGCILWFMVDITDMGVSENSVPLNRMVNDHYPY